MRGIVLEILKQVLIEVLSQLILEVLLVIVESNFLGWIVLAFIMLLFYQTYKSKN